MALVAGLGNPGSQYAGTRHNIGFELIDRLSSELSIPVRRTADTRLYEMGQGQFKGEQVILMKPLTFMNRSGSALKHALNHFKLPLHRCMVCYDDIHLSPGTLRIRSKGSAGGHNGLADVLTAIQSEQIPRMRIGIGNDFAAGRQSDYVLSSFTSDQQKLIDEALTSAVDAIITFIREGIEQTMNKFN
ncbi:MAG: aminoacyl-tRNA hydrolase [Balneolaceae bacterium]